MHCFHYWISVQTCNEALLGYQLCQVNRQINRLVQLVAWEFCWFSHHHSFRWYVSAGFFDSLHRIKFFINTFTPSKLFLFIFSVLNVNFACLGHCTVPLLCMSEPLQPIYFANYIIYLELYIVITIVFVVTAALAENSYMFAYLNSSMRKGKIWTIHCALQFLEFKRQVFLCILYAYMYDVICSTFCKTNSYSVHHM